GPVAGDQYPAARTRQVGTQHLRVDALALEQVGLGGPAGAAGIAAVGGRDQGDQVGNVVLGGGVEVGCVHGRIVGVACGGPQPPAGDVGGGARSGRARRDQPSSLRTFCSAATKASISSCVL